MIDHPKRLLAPALLALLLPLCGLAQKSIDPAPEAWQLVWADEFNGPDGTPPDPQHWNIEQSGGGFGNNEQESYTNRLTNIHQEKGSLVITARHEEFTGPDGIKRPYTSGRLQTLKHFDFLYGRVEARIKIPAGQGLWPAFWMMGSNIESKNWPECGEIDIMENIGREPGKVHATMHGPRYSGVDALTGAYTLPNQARFADDFHRFAAEWEPGILRFYVDDQLFETQNTDNLPAVKPWVFDHPFFILLDLAVGGYWPGMPAQSTAFPAEMLVDYVRVYQRQPLKK